MVRVKDFVTKYSMFVLQSVLHTKSTLEELPKEIKVIIHKHNIAYACECSHN